MNGLIAPAAYGAVMGLLGLLASAAPSLSWAFLVALYPVCFAVGFGCGVVARRRG